MKRNNRKGAIELSANFIVVIVISVVIVIGGLALFFKMKNTAQGYVDTLDSQTQANIKSMMLNSNYRTVVYPSDLVIKNGGAEMVGIGITNIYLDSTDFNVELISVKRYISSTSAPDIKIPGGDISTYRKISSNTISIQSNSQDTSKGMLLMMPKDSEKGQYVYTINVTASVNGVNEPYGTLQVYVNNQ
jgi:hypothetical protein